SLFLKCIERHVEILAQGPEAAGKDSKAAGDSIQRRRAVAADRGAAAAHPAELAGIAAHKPADAELLQRRALHFREADLEHDLLGRTQRKQVDYLARGIGLGKLHRLV